MMWWVVVKNKNYVDTQEGYDLSAIFDLKHGKFSRFEVVEGDSPGRDKEWSAPNGKQMSMQPRGTMYKEKFPPHRAIIAISTQEKKGDDIFRESEEFYVVPHPEQFKEKSLYALLQAALKAHADGGVEAYCKAEGAPVSYSAHIQWDVDQNARDAYHRNHKPAHLTAIVFDDKGRKLKSYEMPLGRILRPYGRTDYLEEVERYATRPAEYSPQTRITEYDPKSGKVLKVLDGAQYEQQGDRFVLANGSPRFETQPVDAKRTWGIGPNKYTLPSGEEVAKDHDGREPLARIKDMQTGKVSMIHEGDASEYDVLHPPQREGWAELHALRPHVNKHKVAGELKPTPQIEVEGVEVVSPAEGKQLRLR